jgi:chromosome segregation ATPase
MADISNELIYEVLKNIQFRLDKIEAGIDELRQGHNAMRGHIISIQTDISNIYAVLARHEERLDRIERRLELRELAEAQKAFDPTP